MKRDFKTDHFLVAYVDALGQSNKILETSDYPPTKTGLKNIKSNLEGTSSYIMTLRDEFRKHFKHYRKLSKKLESIPKKKRQNEQIMGTFTTEVRGVSDSIIINVPLENKVDNSIPMNNILGTLQGICLVYNIALANHKPIRGGIDVGWGIHLAQNEVYGAALVNAYNLETKEAKYPRILVGESMWKYINYVENLKTSTEYGKRAIDLAIQCKRFIIKINGEYVLDVIGQAAKSSLAKVDSALVLKGYEYVRSQSEKPQDKKMSNRYQLLKAYYKPRLGLWGLKP